MEKSGDEVFEQFVQAYPAARRQRGYLVSHLFLSALAKAGETVLMNALEQHKRSEQWQDERLIPMLRKWLEEERWCQILPERRVNGERRSTERSGADRRAFTVGRRAVVPDDEPL